MPPPPASLRRLVAPRISATLGLQFGDFTGSRFVEFFARAEFAGAD
jgi:hypothetical protein